MDLPPEVAHQGGRFSYGQARASGWSRRALARAIHGGALLELRPRVYCALAPGLEDPVARHRELVVQEQLGRVPGWAAARRTSALLMGLPLIGRPPTLPQLARDGDSKRSRGNDRHARVTPLPDHHLVLYDALLMCSPARSVADIARAESFANAVVVADGALRRGASRASFTAVIADMRRWPGVGGARLAMQFADGRSESPGESLARAALARFEVAAAEPQVEVWKEGVFVARVDLLVWRGLLAVEFNGAVKFTEEGVLPALLERQEALRGCGLDVLNTDWDEVFTAPAAFAVRVRGRLAERGTPRLPRGVELRSTMLRPVAPSLDLSTLVRSVAA